MDSKLKFRRILLKLSGEALSGKQPFGIESDACTKLAENISRFHFAGIEMGVVIGGGNIFRGVDVKISHMPRTPADHLGMLSTLLNGIALKQALVSLGVPVTLMSAIECKGVVDSYHWETALLRLSQGHIVLFVGGTGNPYFTTDTAAALRASEINAQALLKATKVDGVYNKDPLKFSDAKKYETLTFSQLLNEQLKVMDPSAVALCNSSRIPIFVFNMSRLGEESPDEILYTPSRGTWVL